MAKDLITMGGGSGRGRRCWTAVTDLDGR